MVRATSIALPGTQYVEQLGCQVPKTTKPPLPTAAAGWHSSDSTLLSVLLAVLLAAAAVVVVKMVVVVGAAVLAAGMQMPEMQRLRGRLSCLLG